MGKYDQYKGSVFTHEEMQPMIMEMGEEVAINPFRQTTTMPSALYTDLLAFLAKQQEEIDLLREALRAFNIMLSNPDYDFAELLEEYSAIVRAALEEKE